MKKVYELPEIGLVRLEEELVRTSGVNNEDPGLWPEGWDEEE